MTWENVTLLPLQRKPIETALALEPIFAFTITHREANITEIGHLMPKVAENSEDFENHLEALRVKYAWAEMLFLNTCNRVLFVICGRQKLDPFSLQDFYQDFNIELSEEKAKDLALKTQIQHGFDAIQHYFSVASSLDSLVVGEREILGQMRAAYKRCRNAGLTGDTIRLMHERAVVVAKEVYTDTRIGENAVSIVSLAFRKLLSKGMPLDTPIAFVGAGQTNTLMAKMLQSKGYNNFHIFNRSLDNAKSLAKRLSGKAGNLDKFLAGDWTAEVLVLCTGSTQAIFQLPLFKKLEEAGRLPKIVVDLGVPADVSEEVLAVKAFEFIDIDQLRSISESNRKKREQEMSAGQIIVDTHWEDFQMVYRKRQVEKAMASIPVRVREVKERALEKVFDKEIAAMDAESRVTLQRVVDYLEKKYISIPITVAKEALEQELNKEAHRASKGAS